MARGATLNRRDNFTFTFYNGAAQEMATVYGCAGRKCRKIGVNYFSKMKL